MEQSKWLGNGEQGFAIVCLWCERYDHIISKLYNIDQHASVHHKDTKLNKKRIKVDLFANCATEFYPFTKNGNRHQLSYNI